MTRWARGGNMQVTHFDVACIETFPSHNRPHWTSVVLQRYGTRGSNEKMAWIPVRVWFWSGTQLSQCWCLSGDQEWFLTDFYATSGITHGLGDSEMKHLFTAEGQNQWLNHQVVGGSFTIETQLSWPLPKFQLIVNHAHVFTPIYWMLIIASMLLRVWLKRSHN